MQLISESPAQTRLAGMALGAQLLPGDLICLEGGLGAGKTWLAAAIGQGWGAQPALTSPTFTIMHEHRRAQDESILFHLDCYRLRDAEEALQAGLERALAGAGPAVIEWPGRIVAALPAERLWIRLEMLAPEQRRLELVAVGERHRALTGALAGLAAGAGYAAGH